MNKLTAMIGILNAISLALIIFVTAITLLLFNVELYRFDNFEHGKARELGFSNEEYIDSIQDALLFIRNDTNEFNEEGVFVEEEVLIINDLKRFHSLISITRIVSIVVLVGSFAALFYLTENILKFTMRCYLYVFGCLSIVFVTVLLINHSFLGIGVNELLSFRYTDKILLLDSETSLLLNMFPSGFFNNVMLIFVVAVAFMVILSSSYLAFARTRKN